MKTINQWFGRHPKLVHFVAEFTTRSGIEVALHSLEMSLLVSLLVRIIIEGVIALRK